jgi:hypothetical protein
MRKYLFAVLCLSTAVVHGQSIYQCKQKDGTPAFQDTPCPGTPNAAPMAIASPTSGLTNTGVESAIPHTPPHGGTAINQQQAKALIDQLVRDRQFNAAIAVAKQNGLMGYFAQETVQGPPNLTAPEPPPPQPPGLPPQQRAQLAQELAFFNARMQAITAKNASGTAAPQAEASSANELPWGLVFVSNADGSVSPRGPIRYNGASYPGPSAKFTHSNLFNGVDLTSMQGHTLQVHFDGRVLVIDKFL